MIDSLLNTRDPDFGRKEKGERPGRICQPADTESKSITHNLEICFVFVPLGAEVRAEAQNSSGNSKTIRLIYEIAINKL